ncbi:zinc transporter, ZIP family [Terribacillus saccharophilus]|uniref:Zinc transporter, ZIP family n=1 Tax=Terribacillus saccharophilus TaxID=361277 RepID=A0AAX2EG84_9BACI|nr:zinc transporter, ZIP family [Terribacillus saccharophilus]
MWEAILWGGIAGSASLIGAAVLMLAPVKKRIIGFIMALGTGALIGSTSYELLEEAYEISGGLQEEAIGFLGGAVIFTILDIVISRSGGKNRKSSSLHKTHNKDEKGSGLAIFAGTVMDAIPESAMIGLSLASGGGASTALIVSIFISNFPEGLSSTSGMQSSGYSRKRIIIMWIAVIVISALSALIGAVLLQDTSASTRAILNSFAGGAIIAMVASTMAPEAYEEGGPAVGIVTAVGMFIAFSLAHV